MKHKDARTLLGNAVALIAKDLEEIEKLSQNGKLDKDIAVALVRYSEGLLGIIKDEDKQEENERAKLAKLSTEELEAKAKAYLEKKK